MLVGLTENELDSGARAKLSEVNDACTEIRSVFEPFRETGMTVRMGPRVIKAYAGVTREFQLVIQDFMNGSIINMEVRGLLFIQWMKELEEACQSEVTVE